MKADIMDSIQTRKENRYSASNEFDPNGDLIDVNGVRINHSAPRTGAGIVVADVKRQLI